MLVGTTSTTLRVPTRPSGAAEAAERAALRPRARRRAAASAGRPARSRTSGTSLLMLRTVIGSPSAMPARGADRLAVLHARTRRPGWRAWRSDGRPPPARSPSAGARRAVRRRARARRRASRQRRCRATRSTMTAYSETGGTGCDMAIARFYPSIHPGPSGPSGPSGPVGSVSGPSGPSGFGGSELHGRPRLDPSACSSAAARTAARLGYDRSAARGSRAIPREQFRDHRVVSGPPRPAAAVALLAAGLAAPAACSKAGGRREVVLDWRRAQGHHARVLEGHPRRRHEGGRGVEGRRRGRAITWKGPLREDDREQQVQVVEGFLSQGMSGIVLAPLDDAPSCARSRKRRRRASRRSSSTPTCSRSRS